jgi:uncharacterized membrane protein
MRLETTAQRAGVVVARPATDDVALALVAAAVHLILIVVGEFVVPVPFLQVPVGSALVLFVPGYFITAALLPRNTDLTHAERVGLSIALSIAAAAVLAVVLDALPAGLEPRSLMSGLYAVWAVFGLVAILRRWRLPPGTAVGRIAWRPNAWWDALDERDRGPYTVVLVALPALFAVGMALLLVPQDDRTLTELYVLGDRGTIGDYPYSATSVGDVAMTVGVANHEGRTRRYRLEAWEHRPGSQPLQVLASDPFELRPGETREGPVTWRLRTLGARQQVDLRLFDGSDTTPYRELTLWIDVPGQGGAGTNSSPASAVPSSTAS